MKKIFGLMAIIILSISIVFSVSACKNTISEGTLFNRSKITIQQVKQVKTGDINWNLLEVKNLGTQIQGTNGVIYPSTNGKFIFISFSVENTGKDSKTLFDLRVIDDKGRIYSICNQAYGYIAPTYSACSLVNILPNVKSQNYSATFDVDLNSKGLILEFTDLSIPPKDLAYIDLGL